MKAYLFPGQGAQFSGMGKSLYDETPEAQRYFHRADEVIGFKLSDIMFNGSEDDLKRTEVTQPAIFLHSVVLAKIKGVQGAAMMAGHSLGEFSALVAAGAIGFEDGLALVIQRAQAMQRACERSLSTMAAILGLEDGIVEGICADISQSTFDIVVPANYNSPGQLVISGTITGVEKACARCLEKGAKRALKLNVGGAFHSPLMKPAEEELREAIQKVAFTLPSCPIYQNVDGLPHQEPSEIKGHLISQLTSPVLWAQSIRKMAENGATLFIETGPGNVLQGLVKKIEKSLSVQSLA